MWQPAEIIENWEYNGCLPITEKGCFINPGNPTTRIKFDMTDILLRSMNLNKRNKQLASISNLIQNIPITKWCEQDINLALEILDISQEGTREDKLGRLLPYVGKIYNLIKTTEK